MKYLRNSAIVLAIAALAFVGTYLQRGLASQGSVCMPTTGLVSGLTFSQDMTTGLAALLSTNSGSSAPVNDCSSASILGQQWLSTVGTPLDIWKMFDGASWTTIGTVDATNHVWTPPVGGGAATSVSSAGTTDIGAVPQAFVTITGTTGISSFGSSAIVGTRHTMVFNGIVTVTYNATSMILPGGASLTTAAGDVWEAIYLGSGNWRVLSVSLASGAPLSSVPAGTVVDFGGPTVPSGWYFSNGDLKNRTTDAVLFAAITINQSGATVSTSTTISGLSDTSAMLVGMPVCGTGVPSSTTVATVPGSTSITISQAATATGTVTITVAPYGCGDGSTTFGLPDYRGKASHAPDAFGGSGSASKITSTTCTNPNTQGTVCGTQTHTLAVGEVPNLNLQATAVGTVSTVTPTGNITSTPTDTRTFQIKSTNNASGGTSTTTVVASNSGTVSNTINAITGGTLTVASSFAGDAFTATFTGTTNLTTGATTNGGGGAHTTLDPIILVNKIIKR